MSMWPDYDRIMAAGQAADELERMKQSITAKATAALRGRGELVECRMSKSDFAKSLRHPQEPEVLIKVHLM